MTQSIGNSEKQILFGLFLSRYDQEALNYLGFGSFREAYNYMAYAVGARPASIKNYRDEFDPYFPNSRQGWHRRPIRAHCEKVMNSWESSSLEDMGQTIRSLIEPLYSVNDTPEVRNIVEEEGLESFST